MHYQTPSHDELAETGAAAQKLYFQTRCGHTTMTQNSNGSSRAPRVQATEVWQTAEDDAFDSRAARLGLKTSTPYPPWKTEHWIGTELGRGHVGDSSAKWVGQTGREKIYQHGGHQQMNTLCFRHRQIHVHN